MNSGTYAPQVRTTSSRFRISCSKIYKGFVKPMSKVPLGASLPRRVPCPPASMTAATFPSRTAELPSEKNSSRRSAISPRSRPSIGRISPLSASASLCTSESNSQSICPICFASCVLPASSSSSHHFRTWSCPCSERIFCISPYCMISPQILLNVIKTRPACRFCPCSPT